MCKSSYLTALRAVQASVAILHSVTISHGNSTANGFVTGNEIILSRTSIDAAIRNLKVAHSTLSQLQSIETSIPLCGNCK